MQPMRNSVEYGQPFCARGRTLAWVPGAWVDALLVAGSLVALPICEKLPRIQICLLRKTSVPLTPAAQTLYECSVLLSGRAVEAPSLTFSNVDRWGSLAASSKLILIQN